MQRASKIPSYASQLASNIETARSSRYGQIR